MNNSLDIIFKFVIITSNLGGYTGEETPGPIPNPAVKLSEAHDTAPFRSGKVGSCPGSFLPFISRSNSVKFNYHAG